MGLVGPLMTWPPGEVVTLGWHTAPYSTFKIELFHDRSPCSDDTFGSKSIDLSCCTNQWHPQKVAISANATLSFSLTRMETGAPVPQKCQAVPQQSCSSTSQGRLTLFPEICSTYRGHDLKFYKLTATLSPGTEYWGAKCKDARNSLFLHTRVDDVRRRPLNMAVIGERRFSRYQLNLFLMLFIGPQATR